MDQPSPSAPSQPTPPTPAQVTGHSNALLVAVSVLIGLLVGIFGFLAWQKMSADYQPPTDQGEDEPKAPIMVPERPITPLPPITPSSTQPTVDATNATLNVAWKTGTIVPPATAFGSIITSNEINVPSVSGYEGGIDEALPVYTFSYDFYEQGRVIDGPYKDHTVYGARQTKLVVDLGMGREQAPSFVSLVVSPDKQAVRVVGMTNTPSLLAQGWSRVQFAPQLKLNVSSFPESLTLENGKVLRRASLSVTADPSPLCGATGCVDRLPLARTTDGRNVYEGPVGSAATEVKLKPGCVILYNETGEGMIYESGIPSAVRDPQAGEDVTYPAARLVGPTQLKWETRYANTSTFRAHEIGGCGGIDCLRVLRADEVKMTDLVEAGKTDAGDPIYVFTPEATRSNPAVLYEVYESWYAFDEVTNQKPPMRAFLAQVKVPLFFWKDALGRWVVYKNTVAVPLLECGKPVIYLYPTKTQDVSVKLPSFIQVTVSDPTYPQTGWKVSAEPNGQLTMKDTGAKVGSLFWEGLGVNYSVPKDGFIVKDGQVESFLKDTLTRYGLNTQERKDFMDFWVPLMTGAPYYRISFLTSDWSKQVPLNVSPAPQTNIRLFMDWQRLAGPIELPQPTITTPSRNGFTLVEWGGLLR